MQNSKRIALITGANKGIGFEIARVVSQKNIVVYVGSRDAGRGAKAVERLKDEGADAHLVQIDVTDEGSIRQAHELIRDAHGVLDILVNNAGIIHPEDGPPSSVGIDVIRRSFETNFFGAVLVSQHMLPLLRKSAAGRIVNISSGLGSLTLNQDPDWPHFETKLLAYNSSKAALNMLTVQLAWELRDTTIKVNAANPNFTDTDLVPGAIGGRPVAEGASTAINLALLPDDGPTGGFFEDGETLPW